MGIEALWQGRNVIVNIGTGGVGKTTVAAALGLAAAARGRRVAMLTIDPSRRLAQALGLDAKAPHLQPVDLARFGVKATNQGCLAAQMLDVQDTFDNLVKKRSQSAELAQSILDNRIYQNFSRALVGSHEYAAVEALCDLHANDAYDLVVVDTPPSQNAIDFFGAPARILGFLAGQGLLGAVPGAGMAKRLSQKLWDLGGSFVTKTVGRIAGASTLEEVLSFLKLIGSLYDSFEARARTIDALLASDKTAFFLVGGPSPMQILALEHFVSELSAHKLKPWGMVLNRMHQAPVEVGHLHACEAALRAQIDALMVSVDQKKQLIEAIITEQRLAERDAGVLHELRQKNVGQNIFTLFDQDAALGPEQQLSALSQALLKSEL